MLASRRVGLMMQCFEAAGTIDLPVRGARLQPSKLWEEAEESQYHVQKF